jgi:hypothetical protein
VHGAVSFPPARLRKRRLPRTPILCVALVSPAVDVAVARSEEATRHLRIGGPEAGSRREARTRSPVLGCSSMGFSRFARNRRLALPDAAAHDPILATTECFGVRAAAVGVLLIFAAPAVTSSFNRTAKSGPDAGDLMHGMPQPHHVKLRAHRGEAAVPEPGVAMDAPETTSAHNKQRLERALDLAITWLLLRPISGTSCWGLPDSMYRIPASRLRTARGMIL